MDPRSVCVPLSFHPEAIRKARTIVREVGEGMAVELIDVAELLVSELVTNAVRHGGPVIELDVAMDPSFLTVRVTDGGAGRPELHRGSTRQDPSGRGLLMVEQMAADWGVEPDRAGRGKTVWFRLSRARRPVW